MSKAKTEKTASECFLFCAIVAVLAIFAISLYMVIKGTPAIKKLGVSALLFNTVFKPTAENSEYGIAYIILASLIATGFAVLLGVPIALFAAIFISEIAGPFLRSLLESVVELLAAIPSVIYGLLGMMVLNPWMYKLEQWIFSNDPGHQFTGGANLLSGIIVLAVMIMPTVFLVSLTSLQAVSKELKFASLALGATKMQTIYHVIVPTARSGILTGVVLGIGRAMGEAMAINMVAGGSINLPLPFNSVRTLTTQLVSEMAYADGLHREVLFTIGLILYIFIMLINLLLLRMRKKEVKR